MEFCRVLRRPRDDSLLCRQNIAPLQTRRGVNGERELVKAGRRQLAIQRRAYRIDEGTEVNVGVNLAFESLNDRMLKGVSPSSKA